MVEVNAYQPNDFSSLSNDFKIFEALQHKVDVEGKYRKQVNHIHWLPHKSEDILFEDRFHNSEEMSFEEIWGDFNQEWILPSLVWTDEEPDGKLKGEEDDDEVVKKLDDENHPREFNISRLILLIHLHAAFWLETN